ncbi:MAG TPA: hypothetical protein VLL96_00850 [Candidatus Deferrimicrobiaceae bacterium]|nr:hypothetical protein [Candidatus Deferrimicrobiaceae bacterium]
MVRAVIDTNVLVSALIHDGKPRKLILELLNRHTVILSSQMLPELAPKMLVISDGTKKLSPFTTVA